MTREAVIVDCGRSAFGKRKGALSGWHPSDLLGLVLKTVVERNDIDPARFDDVVGGCVTQAGEQGCNVTRNAWVAGGLPWSVPATSVDRQCGSSQQAMHFVAQGVIAGAYDIGIACGVESMTRAPMSSNARGGMGPFSPDFLENTNNTLGIQFWVAQVLADKWGITREEMDAFALQSHQRAAASTADGFFPGEIIPVPKKDENGQLAGEILTTDEGIRLDASLDKIASLGPAWVSDDQPAPDITAANSSQMTDGAAVLARDPRRTRIDAQRPRLHEQARLGGLVLRGDPVERAGAQRHDVVAVARAQLRLGAGVEGFVRTRVDAGRLLSHGLAVVAEGALLHLQLAVRVLRRTVGTGRQALPAAVAHVLVHEHEARVFFFVEGAGRTRLRAGGLGAVEAAHAEVRHVDLGEGTALGRVDAPPLRVGAGGDVVPVFARDRASGAAGAAPLIEVEENLFLGHGREARSSAPPRSASSRAGGRRAS